MAGESILVVEDEEANLRLFTYLLSAKGYQVRGAADPQEAMELLGEFHSRIDLDGSAAPRHERVRHQDPYPGWVHGNTTVIIGEREVFVVDSTQFPSAAREDIAQIKQWTDKPVPYLLNTHWHADHFGGNREYLAAYPSVAIIAHRDTQPMADDFGRALPGLMLKSVAETRAQLLKEPDGASRRERLGELDRIEEQARHFAYQSPTLTFDRELTVDIGNSGSR